MVNEGENVLLIQPTQLLADKTFDEEFTHRQDCPPIKVFHGGTVGQVSGVNWPTIWRIRETARRL